jgi:hypothetical protein
MTAFELSSLSKESSETITIRALLESFERSKILEIYFARVDGRMPRIIPIEYKSLYELELDQIKAFFLGQYPHDVLLSKVIKIMD